MKPIRLIFLLLVFLTACSAPSVINMDMPNPAKIRSIDFPAAFFLPGQPAHWTVTLQSDQPVELVLVTRIRYLDDTLSELRQPVSFGPGQMTSELSWQPEPDAPRGYGLDVQLEQPDAVVIDRASAGFDVLERWTQHPRYGFLTDFSPERQSGAAALDWLLGYHINGLQFYDWMYRHDQYLTNEEPFIDPLGRPLSRRTTERLIAEAHHRQMAAMPYTAVYAASIPFFEQHKDWALYEADGSPHYFGDNFLVIMDPRPGSPWSTHLLQEFRTILAETPFDGIHLDQYGAPKSGYDVQGNHFTLDQPLADLINATKQAAVQLRGENGTVIFNAVTNWPIDTVAPSNQDLVYIEVWSPYDSFNDLAQLVIQAQELSGGKPVVIAAYIDPVYEINARLNDAIIFAAGGSHIELGEQAGYLSDPYFPKYSLPSTGLQETLRRYYEFSIRYQNVIGPATQPGNQRYYGKIQVEGAPTSPSLEKDRVMPLIRISEDYLAVNLVNLMGIDSSQWATAATLAPTPLGPTWVEIGAIDRPVSAVWFASPDTSDFALQPVEYRLEGQALRVQIPSLSYWDLILIEWSR